MDRLLRLALAMCAPLVLTGCLLTPGKFTSTLDIRTDRSFTFTYQGEVVAVDTEAMERLDKSLGDEEDKPGLDRKISLFSFAATQPTPKGGKEQAVADENSARMRELAETLAKERGYQSVRYIGDNVFMIDYRISGRLDHGFVYPVNLDASLIVPFIAIELRGADRLRVKAPSFAKSDDGGAAMGLPGIPGGGADKAANRLDGRFTLTTDAEVISQNQEDGVTTASGGKSISWRVTPQTKEAPMAVLRVKALP